MCYGPQEEGYHNAQGMKCLGIVILYSSANATSDDFY